jgi:hypothetical protein
VKDYDNETADDTRILRDRAFMAALRARGDGFMHTAKALDAIVDELSDAAFSNGRARKG